MEEFFKRFGVPIEMWTISFFAASLITLFRIYETEVPPSRRRIISMVIMGLVSALVVPGVVIQVFNIQNPSVAAVITGGVVYSFEQVMQVIRAKIVKKIDDDGNIT